MPPPSGPTTSLANALSLLGLFTAEKPAWTIDEATARAGLSRSTVYRYFRDLVASGLLFVVAGKFYELGPTIIELDNLIQRCDPLLRALPGVVEDVRRENKYGVVVHRLYTMRVVCVFTDDADRRFEFDYRRGDPVPLFLESTSRVMLAQLPLRTLRDLYLTAADDVRAQGLGEDWPHFRQALSSIRKAGWAVTRNDSKRQTRVSAPIFDAQRRVIASFSQSLAGNPVSAEIEALSRVVRRCAQAITEQVAAVERSSQLG